MLSKLISRYAQQQTLVNMAHRGFRATAVANKKPSIGDAVTILQSKVSQINQVVSSLTHLWSWYLFQKMEAPISIYLIT